MPSLFHLCLLNLKASTYLGMLIQLSWVAFPFAILWCPRVGGLQLMCSGLKVLRLGRLKVVLFNGGSVAFRFGGSKKEGFGYGSGTARP
jgi:hypothetical protein